jgi:hypothetical protein
MKFLLEKEIVLRCAKHILNEHIRDSPSTYLADVISHFLNLLLAPFPQIDMMNEGKI